MNIAGIRLSDRRIIVLIGGYGAGKTQIAVSLALLKAKEGKRVALVDLDLINPYFRAREVRTILGERGVETVCPDGDLAFAENPSLPPQIDGALRDPGKVVILDVGGNETGATILGRYQGLMQNEDTGVFHVVNIFRPFSGTVEEIEKLRREIEGNSRLRVQGWINNSNLMDWTKLEDWQKSEVFMRSLESVSGIPWVGSAVSPAWAQKMELPWNPEWIPVERFMDLGWKSPQRSV